MNTDGWEPKSDTSPLQERLSHLRKRYEHDAFCKENLRDLNKARNFLRLTLKSEITDLLDLDRLVLSPESFLDEDLKKLYGDVLYQVPLKNSDENITVFVLIELKTDNDQWTVFQQVKYIIRIWDQEYRKAKKEKLLTGFKLPMVIPVIFHHGEKRFTAPTELIEQVRVLEGLEPYTLNMKSFLFDVVSLGTKDLPEDLEWWVLITVLQAAFREDIADRLLRIYCKLKPKLHEPRYQKLWENCIYYATTSANHFKKEERLKIINIIQTMGDTTMSTTLWDQLIEEGKAEGLAEGEAKGEVKSIIRTLTKRFTSVPVAIQDKLLVITDLEQLDKLANFAFDCSTIEEFGTSLK